MRGGDGETWQADVDAEGAALVGAIAGPGDGAGEVGDAGAPVVEGDGDTGDVRVPVALRQLLLHARHVHHLLRRAPSLPSRLMSLEAAGGAVAVRIGGMREEGGEKGGGDCFQ